MLIYSKFIKNFGFRFTKNAKFCIIISENRFLPLQILQILLNLKVQNLGVDFRN